MQADFANIREKTPAALVLCIFFVFYLARSISIGKRFALILGIFALLSSSYLLPLFLAKISGARQRQAG